MTPYLQWEMNSFRLRSELGEEIRVLDSREIADVERSGPLPEVVVLGNSVMYSVIWLFLLQVGATVAKCLIDLVEHAALVDAWGNDRG